MADKKIGTNGIELISKFEGFVGYAYKPVPGETYWTIGYGHYGPDVKPTDTITKEGAKQLLKNDLNNRYVPATNRVVNKYKISCTQNQFDVYVSMCYNAGEGTLDWCLQEGKSNYLKRANQIVHGAGGVTLPGLIARRRAEAELWNSNKSNSISDSTNIDFKKTTAKLVSSDNYKFISEKNKQTETNLIQDKYNIGNSLKEVFKSLKNSTDNKSDEPVSDTILTEYNPPNNTPPKKSTFGKNIQGSKFPIYKTIVEAPFVELTVGGVTFGTYKRSKKLNSYPNYIQSLEVTKTNGTINEYKIQLIHQISPGDNPNYISELLSSNGFEKIKISYGDAASGSYFKEIEALLINVSTSFDFTSSVIRYTLSATSLSYITANTKMNFPEREDKPSNVIFDLLKNKSNIITDYFNGMSNIQKITQLGLIPTNDKKVTINAVKNKNIVDYISYLTSLMENENPDLANKSTYYLCINDEVYKDLGNTFRIKEVISDSKKVNELVYEVDLGYPDDNMVFDFSINTDYGWSIAMNTTSSIVNYNYDVDSLGQVNPYSSNILINSDLSSSTFGINKNTWKHLTRFPITATLTIKGLISPIMLLTYVKVNNYYFGNKRITSGMYIVTEQKDYISGNGCRTTLGLTRVSSDIESLDIDGRIET